jgi:hypothetical protein
MAVAAAAEVEEAEAPLMGQVGDDSVWASSAALGRRGAGSLGLLLLVSWTPRECGAFGLAPTASLLGMLFCITALALPGWLEFTRPTEAVLTRAHLQLAPFRKCVDIVFSSGGTTATAQGCSALNSPITAPNLVEKLYLCPTQEDHGCRHLAQAGQCMVACLLLLLAAAIFASFFAKARVFSVKFRALSFVLAAFGVALAAVLSLVSVALTRYAALADFKDVETPGAQVGAWGKPTLGAGFVLAILAMVAAWTAAAGLALAKRNDASRH